MRLLILVIVSSPQSLSSEACGFILPGRSVSQALSKINEDSFKTAFGNSVTISSSRPNIQALDLDFLEELIAVDVGCVHGSSVNSIFTHFCSLGWRSIFCALTEFSLSSPAGLALC